MSSVDATGHWIMAAHVILGRQHFGLHGFEQRLGMGFGWDLMTLVLDVVEPLTEEDIQLVALTPLKAVGVLIGHGHGVSVLEIDANLHIGVGYEVVVELIVVDQRDSGRAVLLPEDVDVEVHGIPRRSTQANRIIN